MQLTTCQICSIFAYRMTIFKISLQDGTKFYWEQVSCLTRMSWKIQNEVAGFRSTSDCIGFVQTRIESRKATPSYQCFRTMVRQHIDQTIRSRNFRAPNERFETGALVKSHKGRHVCGKKSGRMLSVGKQLDSVQEEIPEVLTTGLTLVNEHNHPLLLQERRHK